MFVQGVLFAGFTAFVNALLGGAFEPIPSIGFALNFFVVVGPVEGIVKWLPVRKLNPLAASPPERR